MIITWTLIALISIIVGGVVSIFTKDGDYFVITIFFSILIGFGHLIVITG